jgi:uncharacterized membrane protein YidH (DUF202 family)
MKPTKIMTLVGWAVSATTAGYLLPKFVVSAGGAIPISPLNIIVTLPLIGILLILMAIPMFRYRKASLARSKDISKQRPMPMNPFYAVRLVLLAKAIAISGAIFSGWHIGVVWLQLTSPIVPSSTLQNGLALLGAVVMTACAIIVERICRITDDGSEVSSLEPAS